MKYVLALLSFLVCGTAYAQDALVVQSCGTPPQQFSPGATRQLTVDVNGKLCSSAAGTSLSSLGLTAAVTSATVTANGAGNYAPGDTITPSIAGTSTSAPTGLPYLTGAVLYVMNTTVVSATVAAGGTTCSGTTATLTGTTGTGTLFTATAPISGGAITNPVTITAGGQYQVNPTTLSAEPVTGSSCTGAQLNVVTGVSFVQIQRPGNYTTIPSSGSAAATQASSSGTGTGATFTINFGAQAAFVLPPSQAACTAFDGCTNTQADFSYGLGYLALSSLTSGVEDTAFGWQSLSSVTSGQFNTAFGVNSLGHLTTGSNNTAFGVDALRDMTTATNNTAVGAAALHGGGAGPAWANQNNNAFGYQALTAITTGNQNVAIGNQTMQSVTASSQNVAIGNFALSKLTTGANANVSIGYNSGTSTNLTTQTNNVIIGSMVGSTTFGGSSNILLGTNSNCDLTNGTSNTFSVCASSGATYLLSGNTTAGALALTVGGTLTVAGIASLAQADVVCTTSAGLLTFQVSATGCAASSERFKQDIHPISNQEGLQVVAMLEPKTYHYRPETNMGDDVHFGFTAEQVEKVDPNLITYETDGRPHAVKYNELWPFLTAAIKELKTDNDNLRSCMDSWKCRIFGLR